MSYPFTQLYDLAPSQKHFHRFHIKKPDSTICYTFGTSPSPITLTYGLYLEPEVIIPDTPLSTQSGQFPLSPGSIANTDYFNTPQPSSKFSLKNGSQSSLTLKDINEAYQEPATPSFKLLNSPAFSPQPKPLTTEINTSELIEILPLSTMESTGQVKGKIFVDKIGYYRMFFSNESPNQRCQIDVKISVETVPKNQSDLQEVEISGWLLKKKKKKMQGWAKRWCNVKLGVLSYSKTENGPSRGSVQLHQSVFSISPKTLSINIDSGNELFRFKYFTREDFDRWIQAIRLNVDNASQQLMEFPSRGSLANRREDLAVLAIERSLSIRQSVINSGETSNLLAEDNGPEIQSKIHHLQETLANVLSQLNSQGIPASTPMGQSSSQQSTSSEASKVSNQRTKFISFRTKRDPATANGGSSAGSGSNDSLDFIKNNLKNLVQSALQDANWLDENLQKELDIKRKLELQYLNAVGNMSNPSASRASSPFVSNSRASSNSALPEHIQITTLSNGSRINGHRSRRSRFLSTASIDTTGADEEFFDAIDIDEQENIQSPIDIRYNDDSPTFPEDDDDVANPVIIDENDDDDEDSPNENTSTPSLVLSPKKSQSSKPFTRRSALPAPTNANDVNFLSFLRKNIGKDLSTISMPVSFNEPLSILQKMCEEFEYSEYLDRALNSTSSMDRLLMVTAFAFSAYASSGYRAERKPFNPLLGETYENYRPDKGFRYLSEKVSHNPLIFACHCTSIEPGWEVWGEARPKSKFWGKSMELNSLGTTHVTFKNSLGGSDKPDHFVYNKSVTWMRNIVGGTKYIEQAGEVKITNLTTGEFAKIVFKESTLWTSSNQEAKATLHDSKGNVIHRLTGQWNNNLMVEKSKDNLEIIWKAKPLPSNADSMYCFTSFAMELNEITPDIEGQLPITDSRLRPDQRLYEEGKVELAESEKVRLEEGQRARRRDREGKGEVYQPSWFKLKTQTDHEKQNEEAYIYEGGYWEARNEGNFTNLTQIF